MSEHFHKRTTDEIHELLFDGRTVEWRDVLSIVANMNETLIAVASSLEAHTREIKSRLDAQDAIAAKMSSKLSSHEVSEMEIFNKAIGGYRVFSRTAAIIAAIVTVMGGYILKGYIDNQTTIASNVAVLTAKIADMDTTQKVLETTVTRNTGIIIDLTHRMDDNERSDSRSLRLVMPQIQQQPKRK